jgi:hypothetical protein
MSRSKIQKPWNPPKNTNPDEEKRVKIPEENEVPAENAEAPSENAEAPSENAEAPAVVLPNERAGRVPIQKNEGPRVRYCKVTVYMSMVLDLPHDPYCIRAGKCFCESTAKGRIGKTLHLIAGIPQILPQVWTQHPLLAGMQRSGKAVIKPL